MVITIVVLTFLVSMCISNKIQSNDLQERVEADISSVDSKMERLNAAFFKCHMAKIMNLYKHIPDVGGIHFGQQNRTFK